MRRPSSRWPRHRQTRVWSGCRAFPCRTLSGSRTWLIDPSSSPIRSCSSCSEPLEPSRPRQSNRRTPPVSLHQCYRWPTACRSEGRGQRTRALKASQTSARDGRTMRWFYPIRYLHGKQSHKQGIGWNYLLHFQHLRSNNYIFLGD